MIITIIVAGLFLLFVFSVAAILVANKDSCFIYDHVVLWAICLTFSIAFGIATTIIAVDVSVGYGDYYQKSYEKDLISYSNIKSELASSEEKTLIYTLQGDIDDINGKIYDSKNWSDNVWVGWFYNPYYKNLEYIVMADYVK